MSTAVQDWHRERVLPEQRKVLRQPLVNRLIHWSAAISIALLFFTGFGQMPLYKRYLLADLPGMAWTADYAVTIGLHYLAAAVLLTVATFHVTYHGLRRHTGLLPRRGDLGESWRIIKAMLTRGQEPPADKYLAEQRLAYAFIAGNLALIILTGIVKVVKNLPGAALPESMVWTATTVHNLSSILLLFGIVAHLAAFVVPANRELLSGMWHGKVDWDYARHRHCLWCERLLSGDAAGQPESIAASSVVAEPSDRPMALPSTPAGRPGDVGHPEPEGEPRAAVLSIETGPARLESPGEAENLAATTEASPPAVARRG